MALTRIQSDALASAIDTANLADGAVTTAKIEDNAVTSAKIADGNVQSVDVSTDVLESGIAYSIVFGG
jgi:hypothetical protein